MHLGRNWNDQKVQRSCSLYAKLQTENKSVESSRNFTHELLLTSISIHPYQIITEGNLAFTFRANLKLFLFMIKTLSWNLKHKNSLSFLRTSCVANEITLLLTHIMSHFPIENEILLIIPLLRFWMTLSLMNDESKMNKLMLLLQQLERWGINKLRTLRFRGKLRSKQFLEKWRCKTTLAAKNFSK